MFVGLKFQMVAGATALLVPDSKANTSSGGIYSAEALSDFAGSFATPGRLGITVTASFSPRDIDVDAAGQYDQ
jgi:hypothetical protein